MDADDRHIKIEKQKASELRKSRWWQTKIANPQCNYCQKTLDQKDATMDHVVPISRGGRSTKGNVVVCCKECNTKKRDLPLMEWEEYIKNI